MTPSVITAGPLQLPAAIITNDIIRFAGLSSIALSAGLCHLRHFIGLGALPGDIELSLAVLDLSCGARPTADDMARLKRAARVVIALAGGPPGEQERHLYEMGADIVRTGNVMPGVLIDAVHDALERLRGRPAPAPTMSHLEGLTPREKEIAALLVRGLPNKLIADVLGIAQGTVKLHVMHVFRKIGVQNRAQAVAMLLPEFDGGLRAAE